MPGKGYGDGQIIDYEGLNLVLELNKKEDGL